MTKSTPLPRYGTAAGRWAGVGPYYAMFPTGFADEVIEDYTQPGDNIIDPFAGRGTAIFSAAVRNRTALGIEISPLGYVYANAKLKPSNHSDVVRRLNDVAEFAQFYRKAADSLPQFFHCCFSVRIREFLLAARASLDWRRRNADRTLMALILISLHGKIKQSLSNQMRQSTAMAPDYSVRWWNEREMTPPDIDPVAFLSKRIEWHYVHGTPQTGNSSVFLGDSVQMLPRLAQEVQEGSRDKAKFLITSPPYHNVTNYYYDQWLRLWMLGGPEHPGFRVGNRYGGKFSSHSKYRRLLDQVFAKSKPLLAEDAVIYVRTDMRKSTYQHTYDALRHNFPEKRVTIIEQPMNPKRRTKPYSRGGAPKRANCEVDLILEPQ